MIDAFNSGEDIHAATASQVFGMPLGMVTPLMRSRAKAVNFGIVYGIGAYSLSQDIGVSVKEADSYIKNYLEKFSGVKAYMENVIKEAYEKGYVETLLGRRRSLPELASSSRNVRAFGERVARNTPIQGTAADVIKTAMIRVRDRLAREGLRSRLILQVHDELIVEAPQDEVIAACRILSEEMENAMSLKVKLKADVHCGGSWFDAKS
jgi:DNA polymerase I